jgi:uncharacterized membrane protein
MSRLSNGDFVLYIAVITAASSLFVVFEEYLPEPFGLDWGDFHLTLGLLLLISMPVHFIARRRACARMSKNR